MPMKARKFDIVGKFQEPSGPEVTRQTMATGLSAHWVAIGDQLTANPGRWMLVARFNKEGPDNYQYLSSMRLRILRGEIKTLESYHTKYNMFEIDTRQPDENEYELYLRLIDQAA
jgi:hypothetical protein